MQIRQPKILLVIISIAIIIVAGISALYFWRGGSFTRLDSVKETNNSFGGVLQRRYLSENNTIKFQYSFAMRQNIYRPIFRNNRLFVQLWNECQIGQVDTLGNIICLYGRKGSAPGEFKNINDVNIDTEGIFVTDANNLTLTQYNFDGSLVASQDIGTNIFLSSRLDHTNYLIRGLDPGEVDTEKLHIREIKSGISHDVVVPRLLHSQTNKEGRAMEYAAFSASNNSGKIFWIYLSSGQFAAFDTLGQLLYQKKTIDESPLPKITVRKLGKEVLAMPTPGTREINISADVDKQYLYILSNAPDPNIPQISPTTNSIGVIDMYNVNTGQYLYSIKIPPMTINGKEDKASIPRQITIANNGFYILQGENSICFYSFNRKGL